MSDVTGEYECQDSRAETPENQDKTGQTRPICPHGDPTCPCPDGDVCHYEDDPVTGTTAMTPPSAARVGTVTPAP